MNYGDQQIKGDYSTTMDLFLIADVITLYARSVSA